ncbi:ribonuclease HII [Tenacibaculum finnmarkense genomovar finnmarkense]|uniref:Ribonuclease HII n=2 Tax=Tenacibaculum finnmarkense TaxID=2781243 RepID=A0A2I2MAV4_9FLAO|nr:ribonuclease HII [Tenacibaculum finnmarkense]ALU75772.1 ribonuclease HII [Tenacibaculum dicentrarchi]MBE7633227.1 ribonuclease HII [Tenacibaculum finnmarkense genomovar ulcerans]MBE7644863.1 ribonuclease HII [Tenacibaculum finnmarkense genomovar ulcerans]MBE7647026.1 ribonuclease HII [Tenacibaculum finnmarkense genomovar ulcerans]MBE7652077.1 ribonuclease HII [Tenacibaculum finnmarkense genomovar finnmarkense]
MLKLNYSQYTLETGTDEAGRGCLSGPVVAAAVILPENFKHELLNDSKQLSEKKRQELRPYIEKHALAYAVAFVSHQEVDQINVLQASITAMQRAIAKLSPQPEFIIVDGNKFKPYKDIPHQTIVKGDAKFMSIAAASILAKTYRDDYMEKIDKEYPQYKWKKNKGYPTKEHRNAIREFGITPYHRKTFKLLPEQLKLTL